MQSSGEKRKRDALEEGDISSAEWSSDSDDENFTKMVSLVALLCHWRHALFGVWSFFCVCVCFM
jgi:hypothetical protein